jgi:hypothetical protein
MPVVVASVLAVGHKPENFVHTTPVAEVIGLVDALVAVPGVEMPSLAAE